MIDGLYRVCTRSLCAGFVLERGQIVRAAPILCKRMGYWLTVAHWVGP